MRCWSLVQTASAEINAQTAANKYEVCVVMEAF